MARMTAPAPARLYTAEEFLHMPENEGAELVDGQIAEARGDSLSSWIGGELFARVFEFVEAASPGWVFPQGTGMTIWPERPRHVRKPDLVFVRKGKLPGGRPPAGWLTVVPDLVVEVVSPGSVREDRVRKFTEYELAGVREYWLVDPRPHQRTMECYRRDAAGVFAPVDVTEDGRLCSTVLIHAGAPFWLHVDWLWQEPLPKVEAALQQILDSGEQLS